MGAGMKPVILTFAILFGIGLLPEYAHRVVMAAENFACAIIPYPYRDGMGLVILLVVMGLAARWK